MAMTKPPEDADDFSTGDAEQIVNLDDDDKDDDMSGDEGQGDGYRP
jgi:hypothetical protein